MQKKGAKRRVINLKQQIGEVSPLRELTTSQSVSLNKAAKQKSEELKSISKFPTFHYQFAANQLRQINNVADSIRSIELMQKIMNRSNECLDGFYKSNIAIVEHCFKFFNRVTKDKLAKIKQERIVSIQDEDIVYVRPERDVFETQKSKYISIFLQEAQQQYKKKIQFCKVAVEDPKFTQKIKKVQKEISQLSQNIRQQQFVREYSSILQEEHNIRQNNLQENFKSARQAFSQLIRASECALEAKAETHKIQLSLNKRNQIKVKNYLKNYFGDARVNYHRIQHSFIR